MSEIVRRQCQECNKAMSIVRSKNPRVKYCSDQCGKKVSNRKFIEKNRTAPRLESEAYESQTVRKGTTYRDIVDKGYADMIVAGTMTASHAAELVGKTPAAVSRAMGAYRVEQARLLAVENWEMEPDIAAMFPVADIERLGKMRPKSKKAHKLTLDICERFWQFETRYFTIGSKQELFIREEFHSEIAYEFVRALAFGSRVLVLTPPRHGKSEVVLRFCGWLMVMYPNIQILWVAANRPLATQMARKIKGVFQYNTQLVSETLPPGTKYGDKDAPKWTEDEIILYTRTDMTLKSATFTALGSSATVAGRDADFIGIDDLEERKTVASSDLRAKSRSKHAEIMERKEAHTGVVTIASRQHLDDIPNHLMAQQGRNSWKVLSYPAHDMDCEFDPEVYELHTDCMLMPEIRDYEWLMEQKDEAESLGLPGRYPLRYLQHPVPVEGIVFNIPLIKEKCLDRSRGLGLDELPPVTLIAGLDPAPRGTQAAFCWGYDAKTLYMIDLETQEGGGVIGGMNIMQRWYDDYNLDHWIHEDNSGQIDAWQEVERFRDLIRMLGLYIQSHTTGKNKHDPESGISAMAPLYHDGTINLPYGTAEARRKVNILLRQLELWTTDGLAKKGKTDVKMAHWLPFPRIYRKLRNNRKKKVRLVSGQSYPGYGNMDRAPWGTTQYPGG